MLAKLKRLGPLPHILRPNSFFPRAPEIRLKESQKCILLRIVPGWHLDIHNIINKSIIQDGISHLLWLLLRPPIPHDRRLSRVVFLLDLDDLQVMLPEIEVTRHDARVFLLSRLDILSPWNIALQWHMRADYIVVEGSPLEVESLMLRKLADMPLLRLVCLRDLE